VIKLPSIKFVHSIAILSIVLIAGIMVEFVLYFSNLYKQWGDAKGTIDAVLITEKLDNLAYQNALERGLSEGFIGSRGQRFGSELKAQRSKADQAVNDLFTINSSDLRSLSQDDISESTRMLSEILTQKNAIRQQVDKLDTSIDAFEYYSQLNLEILNTVSAISLQIHDSNLKVDMDSLYSILWVKERASQIRGKLNKIFTSGSVDAAAYYNVIYDLEEEQRSLESFKRFANTTYIDQLNQLASSELWKEVGTTAELYESDIGGSVLDPSDDRWFDISTQRIEQIHNVSNDIRNNLNKDAMINLNQSTQTMVLKLIVMGALIIIIIAINYFIISSLKKRVTSVDSILKNITENSDLSLRMDDDRNDEFGQIGQAIDVHLNDVSQVFNEFNQASKNSMQMIDSIKKSVNSAG